MRFKEKLRRARRYHQSESPARVVRYFANGIIISEDGERRHSKAISFSGIIVDSREVIGRIVRRHKELALASRLHVRFEIM